MSPIPTLPQLILEELLWRGPQSVEELSEHLKRDMTSIRSALASLERSDKEPQLICYKDGKIAKANVS